MNPSKPPITIENHKRRLPNSLSLNDRGPKAILLITLLFSLTVVFLQLERSMVFNVLISQPFIVLCGYYFGKQTFSSNTAHTSNSCNQSGIVGILIASFTLAFWMIPLSMDMAINSALISLAKHISLFLGVGLCLAWSWPLAGFVCCGFVKIEFLSMVFRLGWLYIISPERLCLNYLASEQAIVGKILIVIGAALSLLFLLPLFLAPQSPLGENSRDIGRNS